METETNNVSPASSTEDLVIEEPLEPAESQGKTGVTFEDKKTVEKSLSGLLDEIVNTAAKRAGRRKKRDGVSSPTRTRPYSPNSADHTRIPHKNNEDEDNPAISCDSLDGDDSSSLKRMNTVDSRSRFIKMLDTKTLTSFRDLNQVVVQNNKPRTYISRLFATFQDCLSQLNAKGLTNHKLETMAILIHECMSGDSRNYHSVQHVFEISTDFTNSLAILAAMFHDCIYYNVDGALSDTQKEILKGVFQHDDQASNSTSMSCRAHHKCEEDKSLCMVTTLFGYEAGVEITAPMGLNEFLSAVVAVRQLQDHIPQKECAVIASCIAATIPFKNKPVEGQKTHMEKLFDYLVDANQEFDLGMSEDEMVETIQLAAKLANADVGNFGSDDIYYFLDNTWSLLTETNTTLRRSFLYSVLEFQHSLYKMNGFFHFLDPAAIFASFRGSPSDEEIAKLTAQAKENLELGQKYVGAKLLSASVLAAFAELTGGDAPLSLFVGDLPSRHHQSQSIDDSLPKSEKPIFFSEEEDVEQHLNMLVYQILSGGRRSESSFDVKQSPLGAFLYGVVGDKGLNIILKNKTLYPMNEENSKALLKCLPKEVVRYLAKTISTVAISRADRIMELADNLPLKRRPEEITDGLLQH